MKGKAARDMFHDMFGSTQHQDILAFARPAKRKSWGQNVRHFQKGVRMKQAGGGFSLAFEGGE